MRTLDSLEKEASQLRARHTRETDAGEWQRADITRKKLIRVLDAIHDLKEKADGLLESVPVCLTEMGDSTPYPVRQTGDGMWQFTAENQEYVVAAMGSSVIEFGFSPLNAKGQMTMDADTSFGAGGVIRIYTTVIQIIVDYMREYSPGIIMLRHRDSRRAHIFKRLIYKATAALPYTLSIIDRIVIMYKNEGDYPEKAKALIDRGMDLFIMRG